MIPKNILILGGSRFIGYLMLSELIKEGHNITIFNRQLRIPPGPFPKSVKLIKGDRNCPQDLEFLSNKKYEAIIDISGYTPSHVKPIIEKYSSIFSIAVHLLIYFLTFGSNNALLFAFV